jgi:hypothetical protein
MVRAFSGGEILEGFVLDFQPLKVEDLDIKIALIPDLALQQFHWYRMHKTGGVWRELSKLKAELTAVKNSFSTSAKNIVFLGE